MVILVQPKGMPSVMVINPVRERGITESCGPEVFLNAQFGP